MMGYTSRCVDDPKRCRHVKLGGGGGAGVRLECLVLSFLGKVCWSFLGKVWGEGLLLTLWWLVGSGRQALLQVAEELRRLMPAIFEEHGLHYMWAYKHDSR
jgi:hypothetical protein